MLAQLGEDIGLTKGEALTIARNVAIKVGEVEQVSSLHSTPPREHERLISAVNTSKASQLVDSISADPDYIQESSFNSGLNQGDPINGVMPKGTGPSL